METYKIYEFFKIGLKLLLFDYDQSGNYENAILEKIITFILTNSH